MNSSSKDRQWSAIASFVIGPELDFWVGFVHDRALDGRAAVQKPPGEVVEEFVDAGALLGRDVDQRHAEFRGQVVKRGLRDRPFLLQVEFVGHQVDHVVANTVCVDCLLEIVTGARNALLLCNVDNADAAVGALEVAWSQRLEPLLAGRVPDLELQLLLADREVVQFEVDPDRREVLVLERPVDVPVY